MEISQLRTFYEIAKAGTYTGASQKFCISKSAVSHQIKNLEDDLDIKLFQRQGNRRTLTDDGINFAKAVSKFLEELEDLKRLCEDMRHSKTGALAIATSSGLMLHAIPDILRRFAREFPHTHIKLMSRGVCSELVEMVKNNAVDLAIGTASIQDLPAEVCFLEWQVSSNADHKKKSSDERKKDDPVGRYKQSAAHSAQARDPNDADHRKVSSATRTALRCYH